MAGDRDLVVSFPGSFSRTSKTFVPALQKIHVMPGSRRAQCAKRLPFGASISIMAIYPSQSWRSAHPIPDSKNKIFN
jgi:hypothetical protein